MTEFQLVRNPTIGNEDLNELYRASWPNHVDEDYENILDLSLAYICARHGERLVGFVYVAWDGGRHAFLLDPTVHPDVRRRGLGLELLNEDASAAKEQGCEWLHVDFVPEIEPFYRAAGYRPTQAGLLRLWD